MIIRSTILEFHLNFLGLVWIQLLRFTFAFSIFFFLIAGFVDFLTVNSTSVYCSRIYKHYFSVTFSLKIGHMVLCTHLKIILLQYFQFSVSGK